jgi:hypothetical protein
LVRGRLCLQRVQGFVRRQLGFVEFGFVVRQLGFVELGFVELGFVEFGFVVRQLGFVELDGCRLSPASLTGDLCASGAASEWRLDRRPRCTARSR